MADGADAGGDGDGDGAAAWVVGGDVFGGGWSVLVGW